MYSTLRSAFFLSSLAASAAFRSTTLPHNFALTKGAYTGLVGVKAPYSRSSYRLNAVSVSNDLSENWTKPGYRRPLHWVFKIGSLDDSLKFYEELFGMHVHRHEEFASGCEATCNGPYGGAWSKTMIGFGKEETNFALELTYNYGIDSYEAGDDYRYIAVNSKCLKADPEELGYPVTKDEAGNRLVASPDGYKYLLVDAENQPEEEPFLFASIHVADLKKAVEFHRDILGATVLEAKDVPGALGTPNSAVICFDKNPGPRDVKLELVELGSEVNHALAPGRFATETEDGAPDYIAEKVKAVGGTILHGPIKLQPHGEEVVIVADPDGHEYCFVDSRGYTNCVNVSYQEGGRSVDWDFRTKLEAAARSGESAKLEVAKVSAGDYDKKTMKEKLEKMTKKSPVVIFSQTSCPFCKKAKDLLTDLGASYETVEVDTLGTEGMALRVELAELTGESSVPRIFVGGKCVGGFSDGLEELADSGKLEGMLKEAGSL
uniref:VOC domain-containing protein n=1 Tax=Fibrocapsa japonica TaxID=94617 RepID=A0A7S2UYR5_9STRA